MFHTEFVGLLTFHLHTKFLKQTMMVH